MIGSPERIKIQRSSIRKIRKIHSCVWKLSVKNSQNSQFLPKNGQISVLNDQSFDKSEFSMHIEYDFLKEDHNNNFHTINQEYSYPRFEVIGQKHSKLSILAKKDLNGPNFAISEFSQHIEYDFLKEDHKNNFHTINQEDSQPRLEVIRQELSKLSILAKNGLKWTKFRHIRIFPAYRV